MLIAAIISGFLMGFTPMKLLKSYGQTIKICAYSLITICAMLAIPHNSPGHIASQDRTKLFFSILLPPASTDRL